MAGTCVNDNKIVSITTELVSSAASKLVSSFVRQSAACHPVNQLVSQLLRQPVDQFTVC